MKPRARSSIPDRGPAARPRNGVLIAALGLVATLSFTPGCSDSSAATLNDVSTAPVTVGDLRVTVSEGGELESANPVSVRSEVEGRSTIIFLVPEGKAVKAGEVLVRLDRSTLEDRLNQAESDVERKRSDKVQAEEAVSIQKKRNEESIKDAATQLALAENALKAYLEGTYVLEERRLNAAVLIAEERYARALDKADASARLFEQKFISETELEGDQLAEKQAKEEVAIAKGNLHQLKEWTKAAETLRLQSDRDVKSLALARMRQQADSELLQREDVLRATEREYKLEVEQRDKIVAQLEKTVIRAENDGLAVYSRTSSRHGRGEPVEEGKEVKEREEILRIPDLSQMIVQVEIHESSIKKVAVGQRASVTVDAISGTSFTGTVIHVSPVPSSQSSWMNPDLKVYETHVRIDQVSAAMKPGMHAQAKIMIGRVDGVKQVPLQAVRESGNRAFVYVRNGETVELREVETGLDDGVAVEITHGLEVGELAFLAPPPGAPPLPEPAVEAAPDFAAGGAPTGVAHEEDPGAKKSRSSRNRGEKMSPEARKKFDERMKGLTPEQRKAAMKEYSKPRPEQDDD